jgi:hypothetical protein
MKRFVLLTVAFTLAYPAITQDDSTKLVASTRPGSEKVITDTRITLGEEMLSFKGTPESQSLRIGNRGIEILEMLEGRRVSVKKFEEDSEEEIFSREFNSGRSDEGRRPRTYFKGSWGGIEIGFNNFLTSDYSMVLPDEDYYMTLNSGKSINVNLNFAQVNIGITRRIGLVSGIGYNMNNYFFEGNNSITKQENGIIEPLYPPEGIVYEKSKLATRYLSVPLLLELQIPAGSRYVNLAAGPIGAVKIGSNTKTVYYWEGKQKVKEQGDFSLNMLRYGFTARAGYDDINLYATYYMTPLFREGKGPVLNPFEIGVSWTIW